MTAPSSTVSPNDRQVGGSHYQHSEAKCPNCGTKLQHWDFFGMGNGLIYAATKYLSRYKLKGGKESLEKAIHYIEKLISVEYPTQLNLFEAQNTPELRVACEKLIHMLRKCQITAGSELHMEINTVLEEVLPQTVPQGQPQALQGGPQRHRDKVAEATLPPHTPNASQLRPAPEQIMFNDRFATSYPAEGTPVEEPRPDLLQAAADRALQYAKQKLNDDVPVGYALELQTDQKWAYRWAKGGMWSTHFETREAALKDLLYYKERLG